MTRQDVEVLERHTVFQGYFRVDRYRLRHRLYNGRISPPFTREVFERGHAVAILLYDPERDALVLIEQFRIGAYAAHDAYRPDRPIRPWMIEIVAGIIDHDEAPDAVARREAVEEAGCEVESLEWIGRFVLSPGVSTETITLFLGRVRAPEGSSLQGLADEHEDIRVLTVPAAEAFRWLDQGRIENATALIGLLWFRHHRDAIRSRWRGERS